MDNPVLIFLLITAAFDTARTISQGPTLPLTPSEHPPSPFQDHIPFPHATGPNAPLTPSDHNSIPAKNTHSVSNALKTRVADSHRRAVRAGVSSTCCPKIVATGSIDVKTVTSCADKCFNGVEITNIDCSQMNDQKRLLDTFYEVHTINGDVVLKHVKNCADVLAFHSLEMISGSIFTVEDSDISSTMFGTLKKIIPPAEICVVQSSLSGLDSLPMVKDRVTKAIEVGKIQCEKDRTTTTTTTTTTTAIPTTKVVTAAALQIEDSKGSDESKSGGLIIGLSLSVVVVVAIFLAVGGGLVWWFVIRPRRKKRASPRDLEKGSRTKSSKSKHLTSSSASSSSASSSHATASQSNSSKVEAQKKGSRNRIIKYNAPLYQTAEFAYRNIPTGGLELYEFDVDDLPPSSNTLEKMTGPEFQKCVLQYQKFPFSEHMYIRRLFCKEYNRRVDEAHKANPASKAYIKRGRIYIPKGYTDDQLADLYGKQVIDSRHDFYLPELYYDEEVYDVDDNQGNSKVGEVVDKKDQGDKKDQEGKKDQKDTAEKKDQKDTAEKKEQKDTAEKKEQKDTADKKEQKEKSVVKETSVMKNQKETSVMKNQKETSVMKSQEKKSVMKNQKEASVMKDQEKKSVMKDQEKKSVMKDQEKKSVMKDQKETSSRPDEPLKKDQKKNSVMKNAGSAKKNKKDDSTKLPEKKSGKK